MRFVAGRGRRCGEAVAGREPSAQRTASRDAAVAEIVPPGVPWKRVGSGHGN